MSGQIILSINAGSSSVKVSVYKGRGKAEDPQELAVVQVDGLTAPPATLKYSRGSESIKGKELKDVTSQEDGFNYILTHLTEDEGLPELSNRDDIKFACHRVVHGGDYPHAQVIDVDTFHHLEKLSDLAPLHNAGALTIVKATHAQLPNCTNIAYFDSSFHATIPPHIKTYPIDPAIASHNKLRKYGFHGISYSFILRAVSSFLSKPLESTSLIALHLGSGASACCIQNGKSLDNSMGLTPLAGLPGATRSGSIDPSLVFHYTHSAGAPSRSSTKEMHITEAEEILNKKSGWKALTGTTDFGVITSKLDDDDPKYKLAFDIFIDRICDYVGAYFVKLEGQVDALVFAGGIGEKGDLLRKAVVQRVKCLGFEMDDDMNKGAADQDGVVVRIGKNALVCRTDEQLEMARGCVAEAESFNAKTSDKSGER